jgi:hypothetical protein
MSKDERIDLTQFDGITENRGAMNYEIGENGMVGCVLGMEMNQKDAAAIYNIPRFLAELNRMYEKEDEIIEYVGYLLATPDVLEQLMGSPSQIHTINNLTASLEKLLDILKNNAP